MQLLSRDEFLRVLGLSSGAFDQLQRNGHVALAFGAPMPATPGRYVDLDLVGMAVSLGLSKWLGRPHATAIVAGFFHQLAAAVGQAEAEPGQDYFLAVGGVGWDAAKKGPKLLLITHGSSHEIAEDFKSTKDLFGYHSVNISDILRRLRARARDVGIYLGTPFFFLPGDPRFDEILSQFKRERDGRIARLRADSKKLAAAKRRRFENIREAARVSKLKHPTAMRSIFAAASHGAQMMEGRI